MIKILLKGGLGNQMFQYAYGRKKNADGVNVIFNKSELEYGEEKGITKRYLSIDKFNIDQYIKIENKKLFFKNIFSRISFLQNNDFTVRYNRYFSQKRNGLANGYFQTEKYFKNIREILLEEFTLKEEYQSEKYKKKIKELENLKNEGIKIIVINARRGDYVNTSRQTNRGIYLLDSDYYNLAFNRLLSDLDIQKKYKILLFSDDESWIISFANEQLKKIKLENVYKDFEFLGLGAFTDYEQISLMMLGDIFLIPNSTFAWWGAWLSQSENKKVYAPKNWFIGKEWRRANRDIVSNEWIRI